MNIDFIRESCLSQTAVTEDVKWDHDLVFSVGGKMFCVVSLDPPFTCAFKVPDDQFDELSVRDGFIPAPYMARARWVQVTQAAVLHKDEWHFYIRQSYQLVIARLTRKARASLGI